MGVLRFKAGVTLTPDPAGARILGSLDRVARDQVDDLTVTAGSDSHPPDDPHTLGRAFDVRTHGLSPAQRTMLLHDVMGDLANGVSDDPSVPLVLATVANENLASLHFFAQIEFAGGPDEHLHVQQRQGRPFP